MYVIGVYKIRIIQQITINIDFGPFVAQQIKVIIDRIGEFNEAICSNGVHYGWYAGHLFHSK